jgi:NADPH:quinone reductase-like Zn-dependent oxidoreductase
MIGSKEITMKAITYTNYGPADVLELKELEKPTPQEDEVLVRVYAASVNPLDWHNMRGEPILQRLESGLLKPKRSILGADIAGRVEDIGKKVTKFQPGDEVFGDLYWTGFGGFAEFVCLPESALAIKPRKLTFEEAAAVPQAASSALDALCNHGHLQPGQKVLINGASGGVGTFAVQIAKSMGAEATGVCSSRNIEMVSSIGADHVIDYTQEDFTLSGQRYDLIIDMVANHSLRALRRALNPSGICVIVGFSTLWHMVKVSLLGPWISKTGKIKMGMLIPVENYSYFSPLSELLQAGQITPVIDRCFSLDETPKAIQYLEEGHARGKVIITIADRSTT